MADEMDVNDLVNGLLDEVADQARQLVLLKIQLAVATRGKEVKDDNGSVQSGDVHE
jgi:hypothetical protein